MKPSFFHTQIRQNFSFSEIYWLSFLVFIPTLLWAGWLNTEFAMKIPLLFGVIIAQEIFFSLSKLSPAYFAYSLLMGVFLAFFLPVSLPWIAFVLTPIFSLGFLRFIFGISGYWINPALAGFLFAFSSWSKTWFNLLAPSSAGSLLESYVLTHPVSSADTLATAVINNSPLFESLLINVPTGYVNLIQGGILYNYLSPLGVFFAMIILWRRQITKWTISLAFILTFFPLIFVFEGVLLWQDNFFMGDSFFFFMSPLALLSIFFLSTENQTSPLNQREMVIHGILAGLFSFFFLWLWVSPYSILFGVITAQLISPLFDLYKISYRMVRGKIERSNRLISATHEQSKEGES